MRQARQHGDELYVGVHNDADIRLNKGPPVMNLAERMVAVEGCRWCSVAIPNAPYVTDPAVMDGYGCKYVVHGDDITTDKDGKDCYAVVKEMGRFLVVKRTPNISTTDLVGRMLQHTTAHHLDAITDRSWDAWTQGRPAPARAVLTADNVARFQAYATGPDALGPGAGVWLWTGGRVHGLVRGGPQLRAAVVYVDGGFDLFHPGHISMLREAKRLADSRGAMVVVGVHGDGCLAAPVMNLLERALCVLQSKYIDGIVLGAPTAISQHYVSQFEAEIGRLACFSHGPTAVPHDKYAQLAGQIEVVPVAVPAEYAELDPEKIVSRVIANRAAFEERQRRKGWKREQEKELEEREKASG